MRNLINKEIVLLTNVFKTFVNRLFQKSFNINFMKNIKKIQKSYFSIKKIFPKLMFLAYSLTIFIKK